MIPIPDLGLGTAPIGGLYDLVPTAQAVATVIQAYATGLRLFDTAPHYGAGIAETRLGLALRDLPRDDLVLSTKVGRLVTAHDTTEPDFSRDGVYRSLDASLRRLGVDRVDIVHIHDPDAHMLPAITEAFPALAELRAQGVIRAIGVGINSWELLADFIQETELDCALLAGRYTLLESTGPEEGLFPLCLEKEVRIIAGGVFNGGILATGNVPDGRYDYRVAPPRIRERVDVLATICERFDVPLPAAALQFPRRHPAVTSIVIGARAPAEIDELRRNLTVAIPDDCWAELMSVAPTTR